MAAQDQMVRSARNLYWVVVLVAVAVQTTQMVVLAALAEPQAAAAAAAARLDSRHRGPAATADAAVCSYINGNGPCSATVRSTNFLFRPARFPAAEPKLAPARYLPPSPHRRWLHPVHWTFPARSQQPLPALAC